MAEKKLYINGLYWKTILTPEGDREYVSMHISTFIPKHSLENQLIADFGFETINFIGIHICSDAFSSELIYNLDNPDIYVDLVTQELRSRKQANIDYEHLYYQEKKKRIEGPILTRWEILDL